MKKPSESSKELITELTRKNTELWKFIQNHEEDFENEEEAAKNLVRYSNLSEQENKSNSGINQDGFRMQRIRLIRNDMKNLTPFERAILRHFLKRTDKPDILEELAMKLNSIDFEQFTDVYRCLTEKNEFAHSSIISYSIEQAKICMLVSVAHTKIAQPAFLFAIANEGDTLFAQRLNQIATEKKVELEAPPCIKSLVSNFSSPDDGE